MSETIETAKDLCRIYMEKDIPVYIHGKPGIGKSDLAKQLADDLAKALAGKEKVGFIDVRLGMMDLVDLIGLPTVINGETTWARPSIWPQEGRDGKRGIILFDELSDCPKSMQSATYQIILNRRIGPHILPPGWYPIAAGNRREDKAAAQALSSALTNRFAHIMVEPDLDAFFRWANLNDISPMVIGFLKWRPGLLHKMDGDLTAYPTPRSWARVSLVSDTPKAQRLRLVSGLVGEGAAIEFEGYMDAINLPTLEDVVKHPTKTPIPAEPSHKYAMAAMLAQGADMKNISNIYKYIKRPEFGAEFSVCCMKDAATRDTSITATETFAAFINENNTLRM